MNNVCHEHFDPTVALWLTNYEAVQVEISKGLLIYDFCAKKAAYAVGHKDWKVGR